MSEPPSKRRRVELSLEDKIKLIKESEMLPKPTLKMLSEKYPIGKSTIGDIVRKKSANISHWENNSSPNKSRFNNEMKFRNINELVWDWFCIVRAKSLPISGLIIQEKARSFAKELGIGDFKASNGWLCGWKIFFSVKRN